MCRGGSDYTVALPGWQIYDNGVLGASSGLSSQIGDQTRPAGFVISAGYAETRLSVLSVDIKQNWPDCNTDIGPIFPLISCYKRWRLLVTGSSLTAAGAADNRSQPSPPRAIMRICIKFFHFCIKYDDLFLSLNLHLLLCNFESNIFIANFCSFLHLFFANLNLISILDFSYKNYVNLHHLFFEFASILMIQSSL